MAAMADCIHPKELQICKRRLRFLEWNPSAETSVNSQLTYDIIPLFLGADVLSGCSIAVSNLPRMHAKFAKEGLAVKVNFPVSVRLQGVRGSSRGIWFYSIQGLFRVCFEYYSREEQLACLSQLFSLWKERFSDPLFQREINLFRFETSSFVGISEQARMNNAEEAEDTSVINTSDSNDDGKNNFCSTESRYTQTSEPYTFAVNSFPRGKGSCITPIGKQCIEEIQRLYKHEHQSEFDALAETTMRILREFEVQQSQGHSRSSGILSAISKILGDELYKFQFEINARVTEFKKRHITSINNLPPSSELVKELFPDCMRLLLLHWMGNKDGENVNSIIQVILELVNTSLVSGVAHVLYSRLIRTDIV